MLFTILLSVILALPLVYAATPDDAVWEDPELFRSALLKAHNEAREAFDAAPLKWSDELAKNSSEFAEECKWGHSGVSHGENLATNYPTPAAAVQAWTSENHTYDASEPGYQPSAGHFTQVVWKGSEEMGCSAKWCGNGEWQEEVRQGGEARGWLLVCWYEPGGNVVGEFGENVDAGATKLGGRRRWWWLVGMGWVIKAGFGRLI